MKYALLATLWLVPATLTAQSDSVPTITWGGFVDTYYAYHFNQRGPGDAPLLTQAVRNNEFNVNLAYLEAKISSDRIRGRLAVQVGTSASANYAGEPTHGAHSGPLLSRQIQEAVAGYRVAQNVWLDGGIFLSHIGAENWISRDNWTYTRSLIAEYSPYYEAGIRATWSPSRQFTGTVALLNGWQNISENNADKAVGLRLDYSAVPQLTLSYSNFLGNEAPEGEAPSVRFFHDFIARLTPDRRLAILASVDFGTQADTSGDSNRSWYGFTTIAHVEFGPRIALAGRFERYSDPDGVFITTVTGPGFKANGFSVNLDITPAPGLSWRTEFRTLHGGAVFQKRDGSLTRIMSFVVTSLALTL